MSIVTLIFACPKRSDTILGWMPCWRRRVACVCLRSWNLIFGSPALRMTRSKTWFTFLGSSMLPTVFVNTKSLFYRGILTVRLVSFDVYLINPLWWERYLQFFGYSLFWF